MWADYIVCLLLASGLSAALPTETVAVKYLLTTSPAPTTSPLPTKTHPRRGLISDLTSDAASAVGSIFSKLGADIPSYVQDGILPGFVGLPTGSNVMKSAGVSSTDLDAQPTQVLNIPGYGNWTNLGWNLRLHGNVYKQPVINNDTIDKLANKFLIGTKVQSLPPSQSSQAVNLTREIFVVQQSGRNVTVNISPGQSFGTDGTSGGGGGIQAPGGDQTITLPYITTDEGDFDSFVQLQNVSGGLIPGEGDNPAQRLQVYAQGTLTGNATSYLVSDRGLTIVSDIDDILRVTKIYHNWSQSLPNLHFHYLTTTPEQVTRNYMQFIYDTYPGGSFDTRPLNFSDLSATLSIRKYLLVKIFQSFPHRQFVLVADTSNSDVMRDYPEMATMFPGQVKCILLRNTSETDSGDKFPYNTKGFKDLDPKTYMFFRTPDDLMNLDISNGQCYNASVHQQLTFGYQNLPLGLSTGNGKSGAPARRGGELWTVFFCAFAVLATVFGFNGS